MTSEQWCPEPAPEVSFRDLGATTVQPDWKPERTRKPKRRTDDDQRASEAFKHVVCANPCLMEGVGECEPPLQAAHVVPKETLRERGLSYLLWDPINAVALCYRHHRRHDNGTEKIIRGQLPPSCVAWAEVHGVLDALERRWPA